MIGTRFWVVGGEYTDTRFIRMRDGTQEVFGPFADYEAARSKWQERAVATRSRACARFTIAREG
ncbi:MAG TPA: DUF4170 domain-containing protein [Azospirillaceae bacterium]|nr:DUF4170 domain-containing protein [Azospirillaceae bacterium]